MSMTIEHHHHSVGMDLLDLNRYSSPQRVEEHMLKFHGCIVNLDGVANVPIDWNRIHIEHHLRDHDD